MAPKRIKVVDVVSSSNNEPVEPVASAPEPIIPAPEPVAPAPEPVAPVANPTEELNSESSDNSVKPSEPVIMKKKIKQKKMMK